MGVKKGKVTRKYLKFYKIVFDINAPYHVILDGNFIFQALKYKIVIIDRLSKLLNEEEVKLHVQRSVLDELNSVGEKAKASHEFASKLCTIIEDGDIAGDTPAAKLTTMLENLIEERKTAAASGGKAKSGPKYMVATQDKTLRAKLAHIPGIPLLYFNKVSVVLEPPSDTSRNYSDSIERLKVSAQTFELDVANSLKQSKSKRSIVGLPVEGAENDEEESSKSGEVKIRMKRKALSANPLSNQKALKDSNNTKRRKLSKYRKSVGA
jgi:U3 small nucleolar RNA-associated protein 23